MRATRSDQGFTLVELMVVLLVLSVLLLVTLPTLSAAQRRARDRAAQARIGLAQKVELIHYTENAVFTEVIDELEAVDRSLTYSLLPIPSASNNAVHVMVDGSSAGQIVVLGTRTDAERCLWLRMVGHPRQVGFASSDCTAVPTEWSPSWAGA